mgnify:CR=1 FL=1
MRSGDEYAQDLARQEAVAKRLEALWNCQMVKTAELSKIDYVATREGQMIGLVEVKGRLIPSTMYQQTTLDSAKLGWMRLAADMYGVPALVVIQWTDKAAYFEPKSTPVDQISDQATRVGDFPKAQAYIDRDRCTHLWDGDVVGAS